MIPNLVRMSRVELDVDDALMAAAMTRFGLRSADQVLELALRRLMAPTVDADFIRSLEGIDWDGDVDDLRSSDAPLAW